MDYDNILSQAKKLLEIKNTYSQEEFEKNLKDFSELEKNQPSIFNMCKEGAMDIERLTYMINMIKQVKSNSISEHDASVKVGQRLVDEYVKPKLNN